jgi:hypothetical protein
MMGKLDHRWRHLTNALPHWNARSLARLAAGLYRLNKAEVRTGVSAEELRGWLPILVDVKRNRVSWLELGRTSFREPFFHQTVARFLQEAPTVLATDLVALRTLADGAPSLRPKGFIFHMSRCGSTLLSNMIGALPRHLVVAEPMALSLVLAVPDESFDVVSRRELLRQVICALGQPHDPEQEHYVIKLTSSNVLLLPLFREIYPEVPWVFLYRNPAEVIVSNLLSPTGWLNGRGKNDRVQRALALDTTSAHRMSPAEYCARALGSFGWTALEHAGANSLLIHYEQISAAALRRVLELFRLDASDAEVELMAGSLRFYSKASRQRSFRDDREAKRRLAEGEVRNMAERWAMDSYDEMERCRMRL